MDVIKTKFCNQYAYLIQNERNKSNILNDITTKYNLDIFKMYEKYYSDKLLQIIKDKPFISCFITKGRPYVLYLTKILNECVTLMIDLQSGQDSIIPKIFTIPFSADESLFKGTIFYGELLKHKSNWTFLIESCKVLSGKTLIKSDWIDNVIKCQTFIDKQIYLKNLPPMHIKVKKFFALSNIESQINQNNIDIIGIKFLGLKTPICFYFNKLNMRQFNNIITLPEYSNKHIIADKTKLLKELSLQSNYESNECSILSDLFEKNIDIEQPFVFLLKHSNSYGLYNLYNQNKNMGTARVSTIELNIQIIDILSTKNECYVTAYFNYIFNKWEILDILDYSATVSNLEDVENHIKLFDTIHKPIYTQENC